MLFANNCSFSIFIYYFNKRHQLQEIIIKYCQSCFEMPAEQQNPESSQYEQSKLTPSPNMQNNYFNKSSINSPADLALLEKATPIIPPLDQDQYSNNVLNIGFIAEDSKFVRSDSCSEYSDGFSISAVSAIRANPKDSACFVSNLEEQFGTISGMEEWPSTPEISFAKKNYKRSKPETIWDESEEMQNQCTKKKMGDRNRILTINPSSKTIQQRSYMLRSRCKLGVDEQSSSNDDIREILFDIQKQQKGANSRKSKVTSK